MVRNLVLAAGLLVAGAALYPHTTPAAALDTKALGATATEGSLLQKAQYRGCRYWRDECARRYGGGRDFRQCLRRHDC